MARQSYPKADNNPPAKRFSGLLANQNAGALSNSIAEYVVRLGDYLRRVTEVANGARDGKLNCVGDITLTPDSATTTLTDPLIGPYSSIAFMPTTANAGTAYGDGNFYVSALAKGSATITHANNSNSDKTFTYIVIG